MRRNLAKIFLFTVIIVVVSATINSKLLSAQVRAIYVVFTSEKDRPAPVDYGYGPGAPIGPPRGANIAIGRTPSVPKSLAAASAVGSVPVAASQGGFFGPSFAWPIIPIHVALLPDGRVLNWGTDQRGTQGAQFVYDIWSPNLGIGTGAHTILPNTTATDVFCSAASLLDGSGNILMTGGDLTVGGVRSYSNSQVTVFNPTNNTIANSGTMQYPRWYPSMTTLSNGDKLVLGGRLSPSAIPGQGPGTGAPTPEMRSSTLGWRTLSGISITNGSDIEWYYTRGFVGPNNAVYVLRYDGTISSLTTDGVGTSQNLGSLLDPSYFYYPSLMTVDAKGNPFNVLSVRNSRQVEVVDISVSPPKVTRVGSLTYDRIWGNATLLPDGEVLLSGGSGVDNTLTNVAYQVELYNPTTATWTLGASAAIPRLYHSSTLLLPDGSVLTAGGGSPGPVNELNAEIYYPPYLYAKDGSGNPAIRPSIVFAPLTITLNQTFPVTVGASDAVDAIHLIRLGANTHSFNSEQRLIPVSFSQSGTSITATLQAPHQLAPPGYYMLFVLNKSGVPSVAKIISVL